MKTTILNHKLFFIFILFSLAISINSCSDDNDVTTQSFLEKHDGSKWVNSDEFTFYLRLNNNTSKLIEIWLKFEDCYFYSSDFESESVKIVENSKDKLVIQYTDDGEIITLTITIQGDVLKLIVQEEAESDTVLFDKTTINVDAFEICPDED